MPARDTTPSDRLQPLQILARPLIAAGLEPLVTLARRGDLHARRQAIKKLHKPKVVGKLFDEIGPQFADRPGGYTRILKLGPRKSDSAPMALIEFVED